VSATAPPTPAEKNGQPAKPAAGVIRRVEGAEESAHDRFYKKHVPAWVISGAIHVCVIALLILVFGTKNAPVSAAIPTVTDTAEPKEEKPPEFQEEVGLQDDLPANIPEQTKIADQNAQNKNETDDTIGVPNTDRNDSIAYAPAGLDAGGSGGVDGAAGDFMKGDKGGGGIMNAGFAGRSGAKKHELIGAGGGSAESEAAVARGLAWLAKQQKADGSWVFDGGEHKAEVAGSTGLALLPFLAAGYTHKSGKYQGTVKKGLEFLVKSIATTGGNAGRFAGSRTMYTHAIATMAVCEAYGMTRDKPFLLPACQAAINYIQAAQGTDGGWRYQPLAPAGDTSVVGWQIQALQSAKLSKDIVVKDDVIRNAEKFLDKVSSGGSRRPYYGYTTAAEARGGTSMTAVGLLSRYYASGWGPQNGGFSEGALSLFGTPIADPKPGQPKTDRRRAPKTHDQVANNKKTPEDMYYYYYATQVVHFLEGDDWKEWNEGPKVNGKPMGGMRDWLVKTQVMAAGPNLGSWDPDQGHMGRGSGRIGTTCLCLLTLEVYYRHLPLFKRDNGGAK
jgi:hypothetical protein